MCLTTNVDQIYIIGFHLIGNIPASSACIVLSMP